MAKKNLAQKFCFFCYGDLALAVPVVLAPSEAFFDFSFPSYSRFREETPQMRQNFGSRNCRNFAAFEGSQTKFFGPNFFLAIFGLFWPFFGCFWPELYEGATFEQKVFSNICSDSEILYKTNWHCLKFQKKFFMTRSNVHI